AVGTMVHAVSSSASRAAAAASDSPDSRCPAGWLSLSPERVSSSTSRNSPSRSTMLATVTEGRAATSSLIDEERESTKKQRQGALRPAPVRRDADYWPVDFFCSSFSSCCLPSLVLSSVFCLPTIFDSWTFCFCCAAVPATLPDGFSGLMALLLTSLA